MRIQIVDSSTGEVIFVPGANATLEADILEVFKARVSWWRLFKRRRHTHLTRELLAVTAELRELTRLA
jgi:hypothetical protein